MNTLPQLRNVYTCGQFAAEVLCGNRSTEWVQDQCAEGEIKTVAKRPYLIPQAEALRFLGIQPPALATR